MVAVPPAANALHPPAPNRRLHAPTPATTGNAAPRRVRPSWPPAQPSRRESAAPAPAGSDTTNDAVGHVTAPRTVALPRPRHPLVVNSHEEGCTGCPSASTSAVVISA